MQTFSYLPFVELADAGRRMKQERAGEIHRRLDALVEDPDLRAVADADDVTLDDHLVACAELEDLLRVGDRERDFVGGHLYASRSMSTVPSAWMCAVARRAAQHW